MSRTTARGAGWRSRPPCTVAVVKVATINILNDLSRWRERRQLLADGLAELGPDLIGLQEVALSPLPTNSAQWLADQLNRKGAGEYRAYLCPKTGPKRDKEAIAILSRLPVERHETLDLCTQHRVAQWVAVQVERCPLVFCNGHYFWWPGDPAERSRQVQRVLDWLGRLPSETAIVAGGDFNGTPESEAIRLMRRQYASAYAARHGREPDYTAPAPRSRYSLQHRLQGFILNLLANHTLRPWRGTLDYIFVSAGVRVIDCRLAFDRPAAHDPTLFASDHFGLSAELEPCS